MISVLSGVLGGAKNGTRLPAKIGMLGSDTGVLCGILSPHGPRVTLSRLWGCGFCGVASTVPVVSHCIDSLQTG